MNSLYPSAIPTQQPWRAVLQSLELSDQCRWRTLLQDRRGMKKANAGVRPALQAVFCMDVRSEAFRRALEQQSSKLVTLGFAGSFGLRHEDLHRHMDDEEAATLALHALQGMSLTKGFAPIVLLVAHGARSQRHAHLARLQCGACQGRPGQAYARKQADILNSPPIRQALAERGILIPPDTRFVAALHDTDTDRIDVFSANPLPPTIRSWLAQAEHATVALRRGKLAEWGLAGNAALLIASREHTRHLDLQGRAFLHDYCPEQDANGQVLARILDAVLPIACGINQLYNEAVLAQLGHKHAESTADRHGTDTSKLLDELVATLPPPRWQDLRDDKKIGQNWVHAPQRLAVWIDAPSARVDQCLAGNPKLRQLVEAQRLHLIKLDARPRVTCDATA